MSKLEIQKYGDKDGDILLFYQLAEQRTILNNSLIKVGKDKKIIINNGVNNFDLTIEIQDNL